MMRTLVSLVFWIRSCFIIGIGYFLIYFFSEETGIYEKKIQEIEFARVEAVAKKPQVDIDYYRDEYRLNSESRDSDFGTDFKTVNSSLICFREDERKCAAPLKRHRSIIYTAPKYKLSACTIYKNMSSMLRAMMCYLFDPELSNKYRPKFTDYYKGNNCLNASMNTFYRYKQLINVYPDFAPGKWTMLTLIRNPIEKFVSGFVDKCIRSRACEPCNSDIYCFIKQQYKEIIESSHQLSRPKHSYLNNHFFPQNWQCDMVHYYKNYTFIKFSSDPGMLSTFYNQIADLLKKNNVEERLILNILDHLEEEKSKNANSGRFLLDGLTKAYTLKIRNNPKLMEYMIRMYYHDFRLFGYKIPELKNM